MSKYRPVNMAIWDDEDEFLNYSDSQKVLFFYLITNRKTTASGIYRLAPRTDSFVLNWDVAKFEETLESMQPNVFYDKKTNTVFVKRFLKYNGMKHGRPDLILKSVVSDFQSFNDCPYWVDFNTTYPKFAQTFFKDKDNNKNKDKDLPPEELASSEEIEKEIDNARKAAGIR